jgi:exoribonuclease II
MRALAAQQDILTEIARRAMAERGLRADFSPEALTEADTVRAAGPAKEPVVHDRLDLPWSSIDNDDTLDLDQLSVSLPGTDGTTRLLVAIADVDAFVAPGSAMDEHAHANTTSVYTAAAVFPMLPEALSTDLTSLREGVERRAVVVDMAVTPEGRVAAADVYRARVRNRAKLAYDSVAAWLDGRAAAPSALAAVPGLDDQIRGQERAAAAMKKRRHERGALTLETSGARPVFAGGLLVDLRPDEKNRAKSLIEELMIAANSAVAEFLERAGFPSLRRVLRSPERWDRIVQLAAGLGETLPDAPDAVALEGFLTRRRAAAPASFPELSLAVVKLLGAGEYVLGLPSEISHDHFGLAMRDYAHSTAPNRRFPDLVTQRMLKAAIDERQSPYAQHELTAMATHCSRQEDNAAKVERQVRKSAAALLLSSRVGNRFSGVITGASAKGTWIRIDSPIVEGKIVRGFEGIDVGDRVEVELAGVDVERGLIDFARRS